MGGPPRARRLLRLCCAQEIGPEVDLRAARSASVGLSCASAPPADQTPHVRLTERSTGSRESCSSWYVRKSFFYFRSFYLESSASSV